MPSSRMDRIAELEDFLAEGGAGAMPALLELTPRLRDALDAERGLSYRLRPRSDGWQLEFAYTAGLGPGRTVQRAFEDFLRSAPTEFASYVPAAPAPEDRNVGRVAEPRVLAELPIHRELFRGLGVSDLNRLRLLICDGPEVLAWVGVFRSEPFTAEDTAALTRLAPVLRARLLLERQEGQLSLREAAMRASLEAIPAVALVLDASGEVWRANELAATALKRDPGLAREAAGGGSGWTLTELASPGEPSYFLAVQRVEDPLRQRLELAAGRWGLTPRQRQVLALMAAGGSNRDIAAELGISHKSVEVHVSALLEKAGAESRAGVIGLLLRL